MMTMAKFEKMLAVYGADPARWPENDAPAARALLAESAAARNRHQKAEALDRALDTVLSPPLPAGLAVRAANEALLRARTAQKQKPAFRLPSFGGFWLPAGGLAAVAAAIVLMILVPHRTAIAPQDDVGSFIQTMDQQASAVDDELKDADAVIAMLDAPAAPASSDKGVTSDELMNTLFGDDDSRQNL